MKVLDLFSGIGGFSLGLERAGMETVAFCEIEEYLRQVLKKHWPNVPIFDDVRKLKGEDVGPVDLICGGYPCQPFSLAGHRRGQEDDRYLWPEMFRLVQELRPDWIVAENVAGHISMGLDEVLSDLEGAGYTSQAFVIPAVALDAPHRRDRLWIVAHHDSALRNRDTKHKVCPGWDTAESCVRAVADATGQRCGTGLRQIGAQRDGDKPCDSCGTSTNTMPCRWREGREGRALRLGEWNERVSRENPAGGNTAWPVEPSVGRVAHGVPNRVDRLRALGNAVVPQIPEIIGRAIMAAEGF
ncbi:MAG: DNA (cytosine-5-)-methyltransferase [Candidatus Thiodiazotropha endolucinida]